MAGVIRVILCKCLLCKSRPRSKDYIEPYFLRSLYHLLKTERNMNQITDVSVHQLRESQFVKPLSIHYKQNGVSKIWDLVKIHSSVSIVIFNTSRDVVVLVRQFRPACYFAGVPDHDRQNTIDTNKYPGDLGLTLELCAGIVDKNKSLEEIAREEIMEEVGFDVPVSNLKKIITYRSGVGVSGDEQTIFYAEVTDEMRIGPGGGNPEEGEFIEVVEMSIPDVKKYLSSGSVASPGGCIFALQWFIHNHVKCEIKCVK